MDLDVGLWGSVIAWNFLPNFVTNFLHARYYDLRYARNSRSVPQPGQKKYVRDRGWIYLTVVLAYLAYTLHQSVHSVAILPNHYSTLGVKMGDEFEASVLRKNWRRLSVQYHPDKNPDDPNAAQQYIYLRSAYETLNDPAKRLAYDRFGSGVDHCKTCKIESDYVWQVGFQNFWTYHLFNGAIVFVMFFLVQSADSGVRRYRIFLHALSIIMEGSLLFSGSNSGNPYVARWLGFTANQQVAILRSITMTIFVAIQHIHLVMVQIAGDPNQRGISDDPKDLRTILETVETISNIGAVETRSMFAHAFDPFKNDPQLMGQVKRKMEKTAYDMKMYEMPDVKKAYDSARTALKRSGKPVVPVKGGHAVAKR